MFDGFDQWDEGQAVVTELRAFEDQKHVSIVAPMLATPKTVFILYWRRSLTTRDERAGKNDAETLCRVCANCFPRTFSADSKLDVWKQVDRGPKLQQKELNMWLNWKIQNPVNSESIFVYSFIKSQVTDRTCLQSKYKLYEIRPTGTARRLATQWVREQPCKKINRKRKLQLNTVSLLRWRHICHESFRCWWESIPGSLTWEAR